MSDDERPGSQINYAVLDKEIDKFLRTHRRGVGTILRLLDSVPPDRSEAEYAAEQRAKKAEIAAAVEAANRSRARQRIREKELS